MPVSEPNINIKRANKKTFKTVVSPLAGIDDNDWKFFSDCDTMILLFKEKNSPDMESFCIIPEAYCLWYSFGQRWPRKVPGEMQKHRILFHSEV